MRVLRWQGPKAGAQNAGPSTSMLGPPECPVTLVHRCSINKCFYFCKTRASPGPWNGWALGLWKWLCSGTEYLIRNTDSSTYSHVTLAQSLPPSEPHLSLSMQQDKRECLLVRAALGRE